MRFPLLVLILFGSFFRESPSYGAILIEEGGKAIEESSSVTSFRSYSSAMMLRRDNRVGVGLVASGSYGAGGVELELNFTKENSLVIGYGGEEGIRSFNVSWKKALPGQWLLPYLKLGLSNWRALEAQDKDVARSTRAQTSIVSAMGLQYVQLKGEWSGVSVYAELDLIVGVQNLSVSPNSSIGFLYYF